MVVNLRKRLKSRITIQMLFLLLIVLVGALVRLIWLERNPIGLHQDEAYSAYNAWTVMHYGMDSYGYTRPVYYTVWGSGMSVLYSYLTMPLFALWGIHVWTIRLPQAILGCLCIPVAYSLGKELFDSKMGLVFAGLIAINPWHIQQSRFGLDANLAVPALLFSMYFLVRYLNGKRKSIWGAAVFLGLTLYCYALTWLLVPTCLLLCLLFFHKRFVFDRSLFGAVLLLFLIALPLLLFLMVNFGWIEELRTPIFSIPRLYAMRTDEMKLSLSLIKRRVLWMLTLLWSQHDNMWWISNEQVGSYYYFSTPFILLGMAYHVKVFFEWCFRKKELPLHFILAIWFVVAFLMGCSIDMAMYHKVNYIHIPIILYGGLGLVCVGKLLLFIGQKAQIIWIAAAACMYLAAFGYYLYTQVSFEASYESYGYPSLSHMLWYQYDEALNRAQEIAQTNELTSGCIAVMGLNYANVMLYDRISPKEFMETAVYLDDVPAFRTLLSFGRYRFDLTPEDETADAVFVYPYMFQESFEGAGYTTEYVTPCYGVAYK
ncbi:MAG: hypothetical protein HDQ96_09410 [Lachnospiraceae bacterium]|nr:hypothetical protein [Lachnospiraceae bacterium]